MRGTITSGRSTSTQYRPFSAIARNSVTRTCPPVPLANSTLLITDISLFHVVSVEFAVVERILEKHSSAALELCEKRLNISALRPIADVPLQSCTETDDRRLLLRNLPHSVDTASLKEFLRRASMYTYRGDEFRIGGQLAVVSVTYSPHHRGISMAEFQQPYGIRIWSSLAEPIFNYLRRGVIVLPGVCVLVCMSVSRVCQKVIDEF